MSAGNRKNPYRLNTEYGDNLRRREARRQAVVGWIFIFIGAMLGAFVGVKIFF